LAADHEHGESDGNQCDHRDSNGGQSDPYLLRDGKCNDVHRNDNQSTLLPHLLHFAAEHRDGHCRAVQHLGDDGNGDRLVIE
jgi:hypothetical protein